MIPIVDGRPVRGTYPLDTLPCTSWWLVVAFTWPLRLLRF